MTVAELSDLFVWSAATALTITLIAYSAELARLTEVARAARAVRTPALVGAGAPVVVAVLPNGTTVVLRAGDCAELGRR